MGGLDPAVTFAGFILLVYLVAMRAVYSYERRTLSEFVEASVERYSGITLRSAVKGHAQAATAVMMSALVIVGLVFRPQGRTMPGLTWISLGLFLLYILNTWVLFQHGQ